MGYEKFDKRRLASRVVLAISFLIASAIPVFAFIIRGIDASESWVVTAAALAVITSIISAWSSRRVVELQEDAQQPKPYPLFDLSSRYGLMLFRIKNTGGTPAYNINLEWDTKLTNSEGKVIGFQKSADTPPIASLLPGESIAQIVCSSVEIGEKVPAESYTGTINYEDASRRQFSRSFRLDFRPYMGTPMHDREDSRTHYDLQRIPDMIEKLIRVIEKANQKN